MKTLLVIPLCVLITSLAFPARGDSYVYVNYAPDVRYSSNGTDSRIAFDVEEGLYGYGHDFGELAQCADETPDCLVFDYMALYRIPEGTPVDAEYVVGAHTFKVAKELDVRILGLRHRVLRVDVLKEGKRSNSYFFNQELGVISIIVPNFGSADIPYSFFVLEQGAGLLSVRKIQ